jgi:uncharacterized protein YndB with AHSA1/START domain
MNTPTFVYVIYIETTPEKLWEALTNGVFTEKYFFGRRIQSDWQEGSSVTYYRPDGELDVHGQVLKSEPPHLLSFTWEVPGDPTQRERATRVTFQLQPMDSTVKLTLKHEDLVAEDFSDDENTFVGLNNGWPAILSNLKSLLETGRTLPPIVG